MRRCETKMRVTISAIDKSALALSRASYLLEDAAERLAGRPAPFVTILKGASAGKSECVMRPLGPLVTR